MNHFFLEPFYSSITYFINPFITPTDTDEGLKVMCNIVGFFFNYASRAILLFLAVGALDRFIAIFIPFKYKSIVS